MTRSLMLYVLAILEQQVLKKIRYAFSCRKSCKIYYIISAGLKTDFLMVLDGMNDEEPWFESVPPTFTLGVHRR